MLFKKNYFAKKSRQTNPYDRHEVSADREAVNGNDFPNVSKTRRFFVSLDTRSRTIMLICRTLTSACAIRSDIKAQTIIGNVLLDSL